MTFVTTTISAIHQRYEVTMKKTSLL